MIPRRRLKRFLLPHSDIESMFKGQPIVRRPWPEDAEILWGLWSPDFGCFEVTVYSDAFDEVPRGQPIPLTENAPILSEIDS